jgi:ABC-type antimicrobial peptide transport system permease subunit
MPLFKRSCLKILGLIMSLMAITSSFAQTTPAIGSSLTATEMEIAKTKTKVEDGKKSIWVLSTGGTASNPFTMVVNEQSTVGRSANEVVITNHSTELTKLKLTPYLNKTISVNYFEHLSTTVLRFASITDAARAVTELRVAMPDARVSLPITYTVPRSR